MLRIEEMIDLDSNGFTMSPLWEDESLGVRRRNSMQSALLLKNQSGDCIKSCAFGFLSEFTTSVCFGIQGDRR